MKAADRKVYAAVDVRATRMDEHGMEYLACEKCGGNGSKYRLEHAHRIFGGNTGRITTVETVDLLCYKCHRESDHHEKVVDTNPMFGV